MSEPLEMKWCCLNCGWKGSMGEMFLGEKYLDPLRCPKCKSGNTSTAEGVRSTDEYHGPIGTRN